jgi:hypothetical protein
MRWLYFFLAAALAACSHGDTDAVRADADSDAPAAECATFFGRPNNETGLNADQCRPTCACGGTVFAPPAYDDAFVASLIADWTLMTPPSPLTSDPYAEPAPADDPYDTVCAIVPQGAAGTSPRPYTLTTFASAADARARGGIVTHFGHCGVCSSLENLAVYIRYNDLTAPVRACGLRFGTDGGSDLDADVACLQDLGFDLPCAQAWAYDTLHTRQMCLSICLPTLSDPYNQPDGALNPCIQCDEDESGPVFKAVAGRTRRNSGLPNAICRPCNEVRPLVHEY